MEHESQEERRIRNLRDRFASVKKKFYDWFGQTEPHWDKECEDKQKPEQLLDRWERILNHKPSSFPSVHDSSAFGRLENRFVREGIIKEKEFSHD